MTLRPPRRGHRSRDQREEAPVNEDPLTGLPWTETLLPLAARWASGTLVHALCIHFVGLGILASRPEFQSSHSLLREAAARLRGLMGGDDRLTRYSGNQLLIFTKRSERDVRRLLVDIADHLDGFGAEIEGRHLPEIRVGLAVLHHGTTTPSSDAVSALATDAAGATVPMHDVVLPRGTHGPDLDLPGPEASEDLRSHAPGDSHQPKARPSTQGRGPGADDRINPPPTPLETEIVEEASDPAAGRRDEPTVVTPFLEGTPTPPSATRRGPPAVATDESARWRGADVGLMLSGVEVTVTGRVATATVEVVFAGRSSRARAVGPSAEGHPLVLVGEALAQAVTNLLPAGHGVLFRQVLPVSTEAGEALVTVGELLFPGRVDVVFGVAQDESSPILATARSLLGALNDPVNSLLHRPGAPSA